MKPIPAVSIDASATVSPDSETQQKESEDNRDFIGVQSETLTRAWILNDAGGTESLTKSLELKGFTVEKSIEIESLFSAASTRSILDEFRISKPDMLWVNVPRNVYGKRAAVLISTLAYLQIVEHRHVMLEGCSSNMKGIHAEQFARVLAHPRVKTSQVYWCSLGILDELMRPVCHYTRVLTTMSIPTSVLLCSKHELKSKIKRFPVNMWSEYYTALIDVSCVQTYVAVPKKKKQKERVTFQDEIDGPGEHADSQGVGAAPPSRLKTASDVEDIFDDCGDNLQPLELAESFALFDAESSCESDYDFEEMFDSEYYSWAMPGSTPHDEDLSLRPFSSHLESMQSVMTVLEESPGIHDVMELFGGAGAVIRLSIRRNLVGGRNLDLSTGVDLLNKTHVRALWDYVHIHSPRIVIAGPPCTSFGQWSHINRVKNPTGFQESRRIGVLLANLTAEVCQHQLSKGRHFFVENPQASELWLLPQWVKLRSQAGVCETILDQCRVGLCDPEGHIVRKSTLLLASHPCLLRRLNLRCQKDHVHVQLAGSALGISRCRFAQAWPRRMVELIVCGIEELFKLTVKPKQSLKQQYPSSRKRYQCPGCNSNAARHDVRHDRGTDCRFPYDDPIVWNCAACVSHKGSTHSAHSFELGDCQWAVARTRRHVKDRQQGEPRVQDHVNKDAPDDEVDPPHPVKVGELEWRPVANLETLTWLDTVRNRDGWHAAPGNHTLVETNCRRLRSCEPRLDAQKYQWRSVFGMMPDHMHEHGSWYQLEEHVAFTAAEYDAKALLQPAVPVCVMVFHDFDGVAPPIINKTRLLPTAKKAVSPPTNPFAELIDAWEEGETEHVGGATPSTNSAAAAAEYDDQALPPPINDPLLELGEDIPVPEPDWSSWDLGRVLRALRSDVPGQRTRALRKLHTRWFHCSSTRMTNLLRAAGVDKTTLDAIPSIVDSCKACRLWRRPSNKPVTSSRLSTRLNECIQVDLLFVADGILCHCIDEATRFTVAGVIPDRTTSTIIDFLTTNWFRYLGVPKVVLSDQEGALCSEESAVWAERQGFALRLRPKGSHAAIVERHHEILRVQINKIKAQCVEENIPMPLSHIVSEAVFAKNALTCIGGHSPFEAVFGIAPRFMLELEEMGQSALTDSDGGIVGSSRHSVRLREIALEAIVSATAQARIRRAEESKTRVSLQALDLRAGDHVEIWRQPSQKDLTGWRGPCIVVSAHDVDSGYIDVKWQGRVMSARIPDVRKCILFIGLVDSGDLPIQVIRRHLLSVTSPSTQVMAWVETPGGWQISKAASQSMLVFNAIRHCAMNTLGLICCIGARLGRGPTQLPGVVNVRNTMLVWWPANQPGLYQSLEVPGDRRIDLRTLFEHDIDTCWIQFLCSSDSAAKQIRRLVPEDPYVQPAPDARMRTPVNTHVSRMSDDDTFMPDVPPPPPPFVPPPQPPRRAPTPMQVSPDPPWTPQRAPDRTNLPPVPTGSTWPQTPMSTSQSTIRVPSAVPSSAPFSGKSPVSQSTAPLEKRPINTNHSQGPPKKSQAINQSVASSSWQIPVHVVPHVPLLPVDNDTDVESLASTTKYDDDDEAFALWEYVEDDVHCPILPEDCVMCFEVSDYVPMGHLGNTCWFMQLEHPLEAGDFCVYDVITQSQVIEKALDELTAAEVKANPALVSAAIRKELGSFVTHKCFEPVRKGKLKNVLTSRWLFKWKLIDGIRTIKARLVVHGFKDHAASSLVTFANTTTRWGQRIVNSVAAQRCWELVSADVGTAFLQGMTFVQLAELTGEPLREVGFVPPRNYESYFRELPGLAQFNVVLEDLWMTKPIYGLKDAPRAWRKKLHQILTRLQGRALMADSALYVWHKDDDLVCICSTHVDDLKLAGEKSFVTSLLKALEKELGTLKVQNCFKSSFEHCGIIHSQDASFAVTIHQNHYCLQLRPANVCDIDVSRPLVPLTIVQVAVYLSLLGALSWLSQTRADIAIYVQALQRNAKSPRVEHLLRLNKVCKWVKRKPSSIRYEKLELPVKALAISDSAFRKEDRSGLAMRGAFVAIAEQKSVTPGGKFHIIEFYSRKQRRITRSTYSAELHALIDSIETAKLITHAMTEIMSAKPLSPSQLIQAEETGNLCFDIEAVVDAKSVFDSLCPADTKNPTEGSLIFILLQIRELLCSGTLHRLWWVDTRDMLADGLNKGCVTRESILSACRTGCWKLLHNAIGHSEKKNVTIVSSHADVVDNMMFRDGQ